jgi:hypothetical protein
MADRNTFAKNVEELPSARTANKNELAKTARDRVFVPIV